MILPAMFESIIINIITRLTGFDVMGWPSCLLSDTAKQHDSDKCSFSATPLFSILWNDLRKVT